MKPLKRAQPLIPLSHDHHQALVLAVRVKNAVKKKIDSARIFNLVKLHWETTIADHFLQEEKWLLPYLSAHPQHALMLQMEHTQLRALMAQLYKQPNAETLQDFSALLYDHVRYEERELFPLLEKIIPPKAWPEIEQALIESHHEVCGYEDEFWKT